MISNAEEINGPMFANLVKAYTSKVQSDNGITLVDDHNLVIEATNHQRMSKILDSVKDKFEQVSKASMPISLAEEVKIQEDILVPAREELNDNLIVSSGSNAVKEAFEAEVVDIVKKFIDANEKLTKQKCEKVLANLYEPLETEFKNKMFYKEGGFESWKQKLITLNEVYDEKTKGLGHAKTTVKMQFDDKVFLLNWLICGCFIMVLLR